MTEDRINIPEGIGRNDPCPCGSGKKYKKCHFKTHRIEKEAKKTTVSVPSIVHSKSSPWDIYKILVMIHENNVANLLWELSHELSPFRVDYPSAESYLADIATGLQRLPASPDYELLRIRHDGPDVKLLLSSGHNNPKMQTVRAEILTFRPNQIDEQRLQRDTNFYGFRLWTLETASCPKSDIDDEPVFENFDVTWAPKWDAPEGWFPPIPNFSTQNQTSSPSVTQFASIEHSQREEE